MLDGCDAQKCAPMLGFVRRVLVAGLTRGRQTATLGRMRRALRHRFILAVVALAVTLAPVARGDERQYTPPLTPRADTPRWKLRATLAQGFGGSRLGDGQYVTRFPTLLELGVRVWGPLSLDGDVVGTLAGEYSTGCGRGVRPNAVSGALGIRADLGNGRSAAWLDPWVQVHAGLGGQAGAREVPGACPAAATFATAGARAGFDAWLGRGAVTVALQFDYLPVGSALSFVLGGSFIAY